MTREEFLKLKKGIWYDTKELKQLIVFFIKKHMIMFLK